MKAPLKPLKRDRRRAVALIMVVTSIALMTVLILAIFSVTETEFKSTGSFVASRSAKQLGDMATAIVQAQIQNGQNTATAPAATTIHATQPGMVRVYNAQGGFVAAHKLYSSSTMKVMGGSESLLLAASQLIPPTWNTQPARFADLNEPVVRPALAGGTAPPALYFPIIDPRAAYNFSGSQTPPFGSPTTQVEGFSYTAGVGGVVLPTVGTPTNLRLPMPVEWLYVLKDGSMGTMSAANTFIGAGGGAPPSAVNPIIGRIAFWTDDESCKVNVNTASEPTYMSNPYFFHDRDRRWAHFPGTTGEYQRYPGHPATTSLSAVLAPNLRLDPYFPSPGMTQAQVVAIKESIYDLSPKINGGGSMSGTLPYTRDAFSAVNGEVGEAQQVALTNSTRERLFASVDEMLFRDGAFNVANGRQEARFTLPDGRNLFDHDTLERSRFFLTAHSRSPEFSSYGLPRICMWPIATETQQTGGLPAEQLRTSFDNAIALCSTLRNLDAGSSVANSYIFRRSQNLDAVYDVTGSRAGRPFSPGLARNQLLLQYLSTQMSTLVWPTTSTLGASTNYTAKYGMNNVNQLSVQFFDYIRCVNLYDGILARQNNGSALPSTGVTPQMPGESDGDFANRRRYYQSDNGRNLCATFTNQRVTPAPTAMNVNTTTAESRDRADEQAVLPGHGQVTPAVWTNAGVTYRGFGRMFTLSEFGIQFICTADGKNDAYAVNMNGELSGGGSAARVDPTEDTRRNGQNVSIPMRSVYPYMSGLPNANFPARYFSNFPPLRPPFPLLYGAGSTPGSSNHVSNHPGYYPENWNYTLPENSPLATTEKRIQGIILMEAFCPSVGWTKLNPEYTIVFDGAYLSGITLNGQTLFDTQGPIPIKSDGNLYEGTNSHSVGGHAGPTAIIGRRGTRPISLNGGPGGAVVAGSDPAPFWVTDNTSGHNALKNFGLTSNYITVARDQPMTLTFPTEPMKILIYDTHDYENAEPIQAINLSFNGTSGPLLDLPVPHLPGAPADNEEDVEVSLRGQAVPGLMSPPDRGGAVNANYYTYGPDAQGRINHRRPLPGPHFWCYNMAGCIGRATGRPDPDWSGEGSIYANNGQAPALIPPAQALNPEQLALSGRLEVRKSAAVGSFSTLGGGDDIPLIDGYSDTTRTFVPAVGDYRMIAARFDAPADLWMPHPHWTAANAHIRSIHSFTAFSGTSESGARLAVSDTDPQPDPRQATLGTPAINRQMQLSTGVQYSVDGNNNETTSRTPDLPGKATWATAANSYGDFDNGISNARNGPYINKPDEGNFFAGVDNNRWTVNNNLFYRSGYFYNSHQNSDDWRTGIYMTPNRMMSSPVMFGSLPTGVWGEPATGGASAALESAIRNVPEFMTMPCRPWQTLLFRPHARLTTGNSQTKPNHPGDHNPRDHFLLDMFFMPVVEPYAISEPLSVAGRVNLNYQIMPFTYIKRATAIHALMKGEFMTAIPNGDVVNSKRVKASINQPGQWDVFMNDQLDRKFWHRPIDVARTVIQFDEKFSNNAGLQPLSRGLFRTASQICEIYLIPEDRTGPLISNISPSTLTASNRKTAMDNFWDDHSTTGDNVRERPYSHLYSRVTTRSNTFRVHVRAQAIKKARSVDPGTFDPAKDTVLSEYRGSTLIERYIDPTVTGVALPDYGASPTPLSLPRLDTFYQFRTLETKRFNP